MEYGTQLTYWHHYIPDKPETNQFKALSFDECVDLIANDLKCTWIRDHLLWATIESTRGVYDWSKWDYRINTINRYGLKYHAMLYLSPEWAGGHTYILPEYVSDYLNFISAAYERYGNLVEVWEIWNEPFGGPTWTGGTFDEIADIMKRGYTLLKSLGARIVTCGGLHFPGADIRAAAFLPFETYGLQDYTDIYHYHADGGWSAHDAVWIAIKELMQTYPQLAALPKWNTETAYNITRHGGGEQAQVDYLNYSLKFEYDRRNDADGAPLQRMGWWQFTDNPGQPRGSGLIMEDGTKSPAYYAYKDFIERTTPEPSMPVISAVAIGAGVGAGAGYAVGGNVGAAIGITVGSTLGYIVSRYVPPALETTCVRCGKKFTFTTYGTPTWCPYCGGEQTVKRRG